jgi:signal transduction histidine kinase
VKNPLNAMIIHLELLRTKIRSAGAGGSAAGRGRGRYGHARLSGTAPVATLPPAAQSALEHVEVIESEIRRLDGVVQGFLKFTRPEDLRLAPVRVPELLAAIQQIVEPEAQKNGVKVSMDCSDGIPPVNGDAGMLRQVFLNPGDQRLSGHAAGRVAAHQVRAAVTPAGRGAGGRHRRRHRQGTPAEDL